AQFLVLADVDRIVRAKVEVPGCRCAVLARERVDRRATRDAAQTRNTESLVIAIYRMRDQRVERNTGLCTERHTRHKFHRPLIAAVKLELRGSVVREPSVETIEKADEIEQRSDVRVRLPVVVTEEALVVSDQARVHIGSNKLIVVRETLLCGELE